MFTDLVSLLRFRAEENGERRAFAYLDNGELESASLTYAALDRFARRIGAMLQDRGAAGKTILLLYPPGLDFIAGFFGSLYAGAIAIPAPWPELSRPERTRSRIEAVLADASPHLVLTVSPGEELRAFLSRIPAARDLTLLATNDLDAAWSEKWRTPNVSAESLAYLCYTSGSTGEPKGVMVAHGNVLANAAFIRDASGFSSDSVSVNWMPTYHSGGLISGVCEPVYAGFSSVHLSAQAFVEKPLRWLAAITRFRATHSGGPNFCYDLCAREISATDRQSLDLSSWVNAHNAAEPILYATLLRFRDAFLSSGFRAEAFHPCYGLTEATLRVAEAPLGRALKTHVLDGRATLVGYGPLERRGRRIRIVDPETRRAVGEERVGEIWVSGPDVAAGYWNRSDDSEAKFRARVVDGETEEYLRTGDLGLCAGGELFVAGRLKDLLIVRGVNHYPQDIEHVVETQVSNVRPGGTAVFSDDSDGEEKLVLLAELDGPFEVDRICSDIQSAIAKAHGVNAHDIVLIKPRTLPKTPTGKIQRGLCRSLYRSNGLEILARQRLTEFVHRMIAKVSGLTIENINSDQSIADLGIDSLMELELYNLLTAAFGERMSSAIASTSTVGAIIEQIGNENRVSRPKEAPRDGEVPLVPFQTDLLKFYDDFTGAYGPGACEFFTDPRFYRALPHLDDSALSKAVGALVEHHEILRTSFSKREGTWKQIVRARADSPLDFVQSSEPFKHIPFEDWTIDRAPLFRVRVVRGVEQTIIMTLTHHIVSDLVSQSILEEDLLTGYRLALSGREIRLPETTAPLRSFAEHVEHVTVEPSELPYVEKCRTATSKVSWTHEGRPRLFAPSRPLAQTERVRELARALGVPVIDVLLTAYLTTIAKWAGEMPVMLCHHGRSTTSNRIDLSRTAGPLLSALPMLADIPSEYKAAERVRFTNHRRLLMRPELAHRAGSLWQGLTFNYVYRKEEPDTSLEPSLRRIFPAGDARLSSENDVAGIVRRVEFLAFCFRKTLLATFIDTHEGPIVFRASSPTPRPLKSLMNLFVDELARLCNEAS